MQSRPDTDGPRDAHGFLLAQGFPEGDAGLMVEIDVLMDALGIGLPAMKDSAGRALSSLAARRYFGGEVTGRRIAVLAGKGGNGDIALLSARRLADWGADVTVCLSAEAGALGPGPAREVAILSRLGRTVARDLPAGPDLILDGLVGYSLRGAPRGRVAELVRAANTSGVPILSLDMPTGFDAQDGLVRDPAIRADATLSLGLPKRGLTSQAFAHVVGALYVGDIMIPPEAWGRLSRKLAVPAFGPESVLRILRSGEII